MLRKAINAFIGMVIMVAGTTSSANAGNDFMVVDLRTDITSVYFAQDYQVWLSSK